MATSAIGFFQKLGALTGRLWKECAYRLDQFPEVASRALDELPPTENITFLDAVRCILLEEPLPRQADPGGSFGDPPVTLFRWGDDFRIELLFWVTGLPVIHQHAFSGAFHVLHGSSLHTQWTFSERTMWTTCIRTGDLTCKRVELLQTGESRRIDSGRSLIHATFHLERPCVTLVIRTNQDKNALPQFVYIRPGLAHEDPVSSLIQRRVQLLGMLRKSGRQTDYYNMVASIIATTDFNTAFHVLLSAHSNATTAAERSALLDVFASRNKAVMPDLIPALQYLERRQQIMRLRSTVDNPELQFFLALLLNLNERGTLLDMVRSRYPLVEPIEMVVQWGAELANKVHGADIQYAKAAVRALVCGDDEAAHVKSPPAGHRNLRDSTDSLLDTLRRSYLFDCFSDQHRNSRAATL